QPTRLFGIDARDLLEITLVEQLGGSHAMTATKPEHAAHFNRAYRRSRNGQARRIAAVAPFLLPLGRGIDPTATLHAAIIGHISAIMGSAPALRPAPAVGIGGRRGRLMAAITWMTRIGVAPALLIVRILRVIVIRHASATLRTIRALRRLGR